MERLTVNSLVCGFCFLLFLSCFDSRPAAVAAVETRFVVLSTGGTGSNWFGDLLRMHEHVCLTKPGNKKVAESKRVDDLMDWLAERRQKREEATGDNEVVEEKNDRLHVGEQPIDSPTYAEQYSVARLFGSVGRCRYPDEPEWTPMPRFPYEARGMLLNVLKDCPLQAVLSRAGACQSDELMAELKQYPDVLVIQLKRKNLLNQAVHLIDASHRWRPTRMGGVDTRAIELDDIQVIDTMARIRRVETEWSNFLTANDIPLLEIYYEDLLETSMEQLRRVVRFLELSPFTENPVPLVAKLNRPASRADLPNSERFSNWRKVARIVSRIPEYRDFVDSKLRAPVFQPQSSPEKSI